MPTCEKHGEYYERFCHSCNQELIKLAKEDHKNKLQKNKKYFSANKRRLRVNNDREKLKQSLQYYWRKVIFPFYEKKGLTSFCWINPQHRFHPDLKGRLYSAQVSHYYAKSHIYQLWTDEVNSGICCYDCNVNKPEIVSSMEPMIIQVWGQQRFDDLRGRMEIYLDRINRGIDRKRPTDEWLIAMIAETKKRVLK